MPSARVRSHWVAVRLSCHEMAFARSKERSCGRSDAATLPFGQHGSSVTRCGADRPVRSSCACPCATTSRAHGLRAWRLAFATLAFHTRTWEGGTWWRAFLRCPSVDKALGALGYAASTIKRGTEVARRSRFAVAVLCLCATAIVANDDDCPGGVEECITVVGQRSSATRPLASWETTTDCWRFLTGDYDAQVSRNHSTHIDEGSNGGLDIAVPDGTPVYAAKSGVVSETFTDWAKGNLSPMGNFVRINHDDGTQGVFLHLQSVADELESDDRVAAGDLIGLSNSTGTRITGAHLHYSQWNAAHTQQVDPQTEHPCR